MHINLPNNLPPNAPTSSGYEQVDEAAPKSKTILWTPSGRGYEDSEPLVHAITLARTQGRRAAMPADTEDAEHAKAVKRILAETAAANTRAQAEHQAGAQQK
jgi:hypothetical protein